MVCPHKSRPLRKHYDCYLYLLYLSLSEILSIFSPLQTDKLNRCFQEIMAFINQLIRKCLYFFLSRKTFSIEVNLTLVQKN